MAGEPVVLDREVGGIVGVERSPVEVLVEADDGYPTSCRRRPFRLRVPVVQRGVGGVEVARLEPRGSDSVTLGVELLDDELDESGSVPLVDGLRVGERQELTRVATSVMAVVVVSRPRSHTASSKLRSGKGRANRSRPPNRRTISLVWSRSRPTSTT